MFFSFRFLPLKWWIQCSCWFILPHHGVCTDPCFAALLFSLFIESRYSTGLPVLVSIWYSRYWSHLLQLYFKDKVWVIHSLQNTTLPYHVLGQKKSFFFSLIFILLVLFLTALGLDCCTKAFSSCNKQGLLFAAVFELLIVVASLIAKHGL